MFKLFSGEMTRSFNLTKELLNTILREISNWNFLNVLFISVMGFVALVSQNHLSRLFYCFSLPYATTYEKCYVLEACALHISPLSLYKKCLLAVVGNSEKINILFNLRCYLAFED